MVQSPWLPYIPCVTILLESSKQWLLFHSPSWILHESTTIIMEINNSTDTIWSVLLCQFCRFERTQRQVFMLKAWLKNTFLAWEMLLTFLCGWERGISKTPKNFLILRPPQLLPPLQEMLCWWMDLKSVAQEHNLFLFSMIATSFCGIVHICFHDFLFGRDSQTELLAQHQWTMRALVLTAYSLLLLSPTLRCGALASPCCRFYMKGPSRSFFIWLVSWRHGIIHCVCVCVCVSLLP